MGRRTAAVDEVLDTLNTTPARIAAITSGLPAAHLNTVHAADGWSANDVLAHLRACADQWGGCIERIIAEEHPTVRAINPRSWIRSTNYPDLDFETSFRAFAAQRANLLATLELLPPEGWSRSAIVTGAGAPLERTVLTYAQRLARHERPHVKQIEEIVTALRS